MAGKHRKPTRGTPRILTAGVLGAVVAATWTVVAVERPEPAAVAVAPSGPDWERQAWLSMARLLPVAESAELPQPPLYRARPAKPVKPRQTSKPKPKAKPKVKAAPKVKAKAVALVDAAETCSSDLDNTLPHVARAGHHIADKFDVDTVFGRAGRGGPSDHPAGLALDFMVDAATGDKLADYVLDHKDDLNVTYVIWQQRINHGSGWRQMEDRGNPTANHEDHVHVSFEPEGGDGLPC